MHCPDCTPYTRRRGTDCVRRTAVGNAADVASLDVIQPADGPRPHLQIHTRALLNTHEDKRMPVAAVTGATGFIGRRLVPKLQAAGWRVRALVRSAARAGQIKELAGAELVVGDLQQADSLQRLVGGAHAVVHCAGAVRGVTPEQFDRVNVEGVVRVVEASRAQSRPPRLLSLSSLAAREPGLSPYAASKHKGEQALAATAGAMPWAALRPPAVYGPGDKELLPLFRLMALGLAPLPGSPRARFSVIYVDDLTNAIVRWLDTAQDTGGIYELHDGTAGGYCWDDVIGIVQRITGRRVRRVKIPLPLLQLPAACNWIAGRILPYAPMLTPGKIRELRHPDWVCDNGAIQRAIDWQPAVDLEQGLRLTPGWRSRSVPERPSVSN